MPMVDGEHFSYTKAGYRAAAKARALKRRAGREAKREGHMMPGMPAREGHMPTMRDRPSGSAAMASGFRRRGY